MDVVGVDRKEAPANAAYIAHACNAYPTLVEALRSCVKAQDVTAGVKGSSELAATEGARFLLRSLGEIA